MQVIRSNEVKTTEAKIILAITFTLFAGITLLVPSFPPAQLLYESVRIPRATTSLGGISIATILNLVTNGFFWVLIAATLLGVARFFKEPAPLPPMPDAPQLVSPPPENPLIDSRANKIPPALTIPSVTQSLKAREQPARALVRTVFVPIRISKAFIGEKLDVETIEGVGPMYGGLLRNAGINTIGDLLRIGDTVRGQQRIANEIGVTSATVVRWVRRGDLLRVKGVGRKYSALLESAGVNTVADLSRKDPNYLCQWLEAFNRERNLVRRTPPPKTIELWVRNARSLEPIIVE